jgi:hypothetical protein
MDYLIWNELESHMSLDEIANRVKIAKLLGYDIIVPQKKFSCGEFLTEMVAVSSGVSPLSTLVEGPNPPPEN